MCCSRPNAEVRVVDDEGQEVAQDGATMGEIIIRGNAVMKGYYNDPEATAKAIGNGWFHSGDAAVVQPDGYIEIRDRWKDIIISGGENISSIEVEGALLRHPAVQEVAAVGLPHEKWGETPQAFIVLKPGGESTPEAMRGCCREHLAHFEVPHGFESIAELPKTATGKIQKYVLRGGKGEHGEAVTLPGRWRWFAVVCCRLRWFGGSPMRFLPPSTASACEGQPHRFDRR